MPYDSIEDLPDPVKVEVSRRTIKRRSEGMDIGHECIKAELEEVALHNNRIWHTTQGNYYGEEKPKLDLFPSQLKCGFHVSVLDPYPEGA